MELFCDPTATGFDAEIFQDERTHVAVDARWCTEMCRLNARARLFYWTLFLLFFAALAFVWCPGNKGALMVDTALRNLFETESFSGNECVDPIASSDDFYA